MERCLFIEARIWFLSFPLVYFPPKHSQSPSTIQFHRPVANNYHPQQKYGPTLAFIKSCRSTIHIKKIHWLAQIWDWLMFLGQEKILPGGLPASSSSNPLFSERCHDHAQREMGHEEQTHWPIYPSLPLVKSRQSCSRWDKSDVNLRNILDCLDHYMAPNSKYTGGECPPQIQVNVHIPKNVLSGFEENKNSPLRELEWFKDGLCIYPGVCIYSGGETRHSWNLDFKVEFDIEGQG